MDAKLNRAVELLEKYQFIAPDWKLSVKIGKVTVDNGDAMMLIDDRERRAAITIRKDLPIEHIEHSIVHEMAHLTTRRLELMFLQLMKAKTSESERQMIAETMYELGEETIENIVRAIFGVQGIEYGSEPKL